MSALLIDDQTEVEKSLKKNVFLKMICVNAHTGSNSLSLSHTPTHAHTPDLHTLLLKMIFY